jgi:prepilin-type N-terminal cleavage/methylation domain-containing protein
MRRSPPTRVWHAPRPRRAGFTLIELLLVIAIIALLVTLSMRGLAGARNNARTAVCLSNQRQIAVGYAAYAMDFRGRIWPANQWARLPDNTGPNPGLLYRYVSNVDRIGECPSNQRRGSRSQSGNNMFGTGTFLDFDYTMVYAASGARIDSATRVAFLSNPATGGSPGSLPPGMILPASMTALTPMRGLPVFVEESTFWFNDQYTDGLWSNMDQISERHAGKGSVVYLAGDAELLDFPHGPRPDLQENEDLDANDLYALRGNAGQWIRLQPDAGNWTRRPFGWIENPRP